MKEQFELKLRKEFNQKLSTLNLTVQGDKEYFWEWLIQKINENTHHNSQL